MYIRIIMKNPLNGISFKKTKVSVRIIYLILLLNVISIAHVQYWNNEHKIIAWDVKSYYSYLPAAFIHKDLTLKFVDEDKNKYQSLYWPNKTENNRNVIKMSMGLSYLYMPFFFLGHGGAHLLGYEADGYSFPYRFALILSSFLFLILGLLYTRKVLLFFYNE